jgi:hypothetical protein
MKSDLSGDVRAADSDDIVHREPHRDRRLQGARRLADRDIPNG